MRYRFEQPRTSRGEARDEHARQGQQRERDPSTARLSVRRGFDRADQLEPRITDVADALVHVPHEAELQDAPGLQRRL